MKKSGLIVVALFVATNVFSQKWGQSIIEADDLKGIPAYTAETFVDLTNNGSFTYWSIKEDDFRIQSISKIFKSNGQKGYLGNSLVIGLVGFYNENDELIEKFDKFPFEEDGYDKMNIVHPNRYTLKGGNNKKKSKRIIDYIQKEKGYVRFVLPLFGGGNLDFKVLCINNKS